MTIPQDPIILLSFINLKLRDNYSTLDELCTDMNIDKNMLVQKLRGIDYEYNTEINQFR